ncbi:TIGR00730 family Rossman fold protein [Pseudahrensia aquimaris]|uniref:Cytokinin riboside 5'-monophosphate phosphoribohydrolase n=1 Tax=Pseudahrensia aquimaris TaxID=744461 RepID=A0ABW3FB94_9HYPH
MVDTPSPIRSVCVYCGSSMGENPLYAEQAASLGQLLAEADIRLVYGGGSIGLMGVIAKNVLAHGGAVLGIIPEFLKAHERVAAAGDLEGAELQVVPDMHTRKRLMFEEADAFVAMAGGIGTLEELVEMMTWAQLGRHEKPIALLNTNGFWHAFDELVNDMASAGFVHNHQRIKPVLVDGPEEILAALGVTPS